jgi:hypothetical protein
MWVSSVSDRAYRLHISGWKRAVGLCKQLWLYRPHALHRISSVLVLPCRAGDAGKVTVGSGSNLQDGTVVRTHEARLGADVLPGPHPDTVIGDHVTIGHQVWSI